MDLVALLWDNPSLRATTRKKGGKHAGTKMHKTMPSHSASRIESVKRKETEMLPRNAAWVLV